MFVKLVKLMMGNREVDSSNPVPIGQSTHDDLNCNANLQIGNADNAVGNPAFVEVTGSITGDSTSDSITRPNDTTAYTALDVVGENPAVNLQFDNVIPSAGLFVVLGARIRIDVNAIPAGMTSFRLHLYNAAPTAIADNVAYNLPEADRGKYLGYITLSTITDNGDTVWVQDDNLNFTGEISGTTLYGILQTVGAYTPSAQTVYTVMLNAAPV